MEGLLEVEGLLALDCPPWTTLFLPLPQATLRDKPSISVPKRSLFICFPSENLVSARNVVCADISNMGEAGRQMDWLKTLKNLGIFY